MNNCGRNENFPLYTQKVLTNFLADKMPALHKHVAIGFS